jgi:hypothetical protein
MISFTLEDIHSGLYDARHCLELELTRLTVDDNPEEYFRAVHGAKSIDDRLAELRISKYDGAKYIADEDDYRAEVEVQIER